MTPRPRERPGTTAGPFMHGAHVAVQYLKHPGTPHWRHDPMTVLGNDEHGTWLGGGPHTFLKKGRMEHPTNDHERGFHADHPFVQLVAPDAWWTLIFNGPDHPVTHYVDIVTPAELAGSEVRLVDLDLDVVRRLGGAPYIEDEDEFIEHASTLGYPPMWVDRARSEAVRVLLALEAGEEPFATACHRWWRRHTDT